MTLMNLTQSDLSSLVHLAQVLTPTSFTPMGMVIASLVDTTSIVMLVLQ